MPVKLIATVFPEINTKFGFNPSAAPTTPPPAGDGVTPPPAGDAASFALSVSTPGLTPTEAKLFGIMKGKLLRFKIVNSLTSYIQYARGYFDGIGGLAFQYIGDENGDGEVVQGSYKVTGNDNGLDGYLTFHFHRPTGNYIMSDYTFYGMTDGSELWFQHVEMGTNVTGDGKQIA